MNFERLTLTNFRVFKGRHSFDLSPKEDSVRYRPLILFGGLNGAGKTTILTAVRLALYGKRSLGVGTSLKDYRDYLKRSMYVTRTGELQPLEHTSIKLSFTYSHMGYSSKFDVKRSWIISRGKVSETLSIRQDNEPVENISYKQCQAFLDGLIPIGVSNLFFFDGEKIKELAEDNSGLMLAYAVKKLYGLDVIERLKSDLLIIMRRKSFSNATDKIKLKVSQLEHELIECEAEIEAETLAYEHSRINFYQLKSEADILKDELNLKGGAWAENRENEITRRSRLVANKNATEDKIIDLISGIYPLLLANGVVNDCLEQLKSENKFKQVVTTNDRVREYLQKLKSKFDQNLEGNVRKTVVSSFESELLRLSEPPLNMPLLHDISGTVYTRFTAIFENSASSQKSELNELVCELKKLKSKITSTERNIARAPDAETLIEEFQRISKKQEQISKLTAEMDAHKNKIKLHLRTAMKITRQLEELSNRLVEISEIDKTLLYAEKARAVLTEFVDGLVVMKVKEFEKEFTRCYLRLTNKKRAISKVDVDPKTFSVSVVDKDGLTTRREDLSAGEKQIYAISVLATLARTSGRKLPIIIDTPLARLDLKHRQNLVRHYLPHASHQVLIFSTDTEVDKQIYSDLLDYTARTYRLKFNVESKSSIVEEGYFWSTE